MRKLFNKMLYDTNFIFYELLILCGISLSYILYQVIKLNLSINPLVFVVILGLVSESIRLSRFKIKDLNYLMGGFLFSLINFNSIGSPNFVFSVTFDRWPFFLIPSLAFTAMVIFKEKVISQIDIKTTIISSLSVAYLFFEYGFNQLGFITNLITFALFLILFISSFSKKQLSKKSRLYLSCWSVILILIISSFYGVYIFDYSDGLKSKNTFIQLQTYLLFFTFGMTFIHTLQNIFLLYDFISPEKSENDIHIKHLKQAHIERYDDKKPKPLSFFIITSFVALFFILNYLYSFIHTLTAIWIVYLLLAKKESRFR